MNNPRQNIVEATQLHHPDLHNLIEDQIQILRVRDFVKEKTREKLLKLARETKGTDYLNDMKIDGVMQKVPYGVWRVGPALNTVFGTENPKEQKTLFEKYFDEAKETREKISTALNGLLSPIEDLFNQINNIWDKGIEVAKIKGRQLMSGILRGTEAGITPMVEHPHIDVVRDNVIKGIEKQLSALLVLSTPKVGGALKVFSGEIYQANGKEPEESFIKRICRQEKPTVIKPEPGDLIMFNTRHPHATTPFTNEDLDRIAMQTFIGLREGKLLAWN